MSSSFQKASRLTLKCLALSIIIRGASHSSCGLNFCPVPKAQDISKSKYLNAGISSKYTSFELGGREGFYTELLPKVEYVGFGKYIFGTSLPVVNLNDDSGSVIGMGNPLIYSEYRMTFNASTLMYAGMQLEIPLGNHEDGLAGDHLMVLPYVSMTRHMGHIAYLSGTLGFSSVLGGDSHDTAQSGPVVNPHANQEGHFRAALGGDWINLKISPEAYVQGQIVAEDHAEDRIFISSGTSLLFHLRETIGLQAGFEYHVTSPSRFNWRSGLGLKIGI